MAQAQAVEKKQMRTPIESGCPDGMQYMHPLMIKNFGNWKYHDRPRPGVLHHVAYSGDEIWTAGAGDQASWLATDGRRVLCLGSSAHARALDLDSGEVVWDSSVAGATTGLWAFQGLLMAPEGNLENPRLVVPRP